MADDWGSVTIDGREAHTIATLLARLSICLKASGIRTICSSPTTRSRSSRRPTRRHRSNSPRSCAITPPASRAGYRKRCRASGRILHGPETPRGATAQRRACGQPRGMAVLPVGPNGRLGCRLRIWVSTCGWHRFPPPALAPFGWRVAAISQSETRRGGRRRASTSWYRQIARVRRVIALSGEATVLGPSVRSSCPGGFEERYATRPAVRLELRGLGEHVVRPVGDLTEATAPALCRSVAVPLSNGAPRIVLDLSMTRRIDAGGRRALIECSRAVRCAHGTLALVSAPVTSETCSERPMPSTTRRRAWPPRSSPRSMSWGAAPSP